ncbi:hypothetical protein FRC01_005170 [Tulasnella sp. 417]|nr:hypothetical protein FRC01_005170 [Tulasnella sp. 417]
MSNFFGNHQALQECIESLSHLFVDITRLKHEPSYEEKRGGYCDLQVATLDPDIPGASKLVAAKKLLLGTRSPEPKRLAFRLARELKVWAGLRHPHVLPLLGFYLGGDYKTAVLISEYMEYGDLKEYIAKMAPTYNQRLHLAMIDKIPFAEIQPEPQLIIALIQGRIPCDPENLDVHLPQFNDLLVKCWSRQPSQRPNAADCLCIIQSALPPLEPQPQHRSPAQQTSSPVQATTNQANDTLQASPQVSHQLSSCPPDKLIQFQKYFDLALNNWLILRQLTLDPPCVGGKEVELHKLFLIVGLLGGWRAVLERGLWPFIGEQLELPQLDEPMTPSNLDSTEELRNIYQTVLAEFEADWHEAIRPNDPSSTFPLPPKLQHLRPELEGLAPTQTTWAKQHRQGSRSSETEFQELARNNARESTPNQTV